MREKFNKSVLSKIALYTLLAIVTLVIGISVGLWQIKPPRVNESSPNYPAYQQMMENIRLFTSMGPHPSGSEEIEVVRAMIIAEIEDMGLTPVIQEKLYSKDEVLEYVERFLEMSIDEFFEINRESLARHFDIHTIDELMDEFFSVVASLDENGKLSIQNILVKIDSPTSDKGVMFMAHYDSTPETPGAADAMAGVCAILETMRKYANSENLESDLYFLLTDGEEVALLGAYAFIEAYPELKDKVDLVVNFEARGNRGGLLLFETSPEAHSLMRAVRKSGANPIGMSWLVAIYKMMPNDTDLTLFLNEGYNGVNFAIVGGVEHYHMLTDSYENLDRNSAWQYLHTALSLADYAANNPTSTFNKPSWETVFFNFLSFTVIMTVAKSYFLCANICIVALILLIALIKTKSLKVFPAIGMILLLVLSVVTAFIFPAGNYLFYIPLLCMIITQLFREKKDLLIISRVVSGIIFLLLWVPTVAIIWMLLVQPMLVELGRVS